MPGAGDWVNSQLPFENSQEETNVCGDWSVTRTSERDGQLQRDRNKVFEMTGLEDGAWKLRKDNQDRN